MFNLYISKSQTKDVKNENMKNMRKKSLIQSRNKNLETNLLNQTVIRIYQTLVIKQNG